MSSFFSRLVTLLFASSNFLVEFSTFLVASSDILEQKHFYKNQSDLFFKIVSERSTSEKLISNTIVRVNSIYLSSCD